MNINKKQPNRNKSKHQNEGDPPKVVKVMFAPDASSYYGSLVSVFKKVLEEETDELVESSQTKGMHGTLCCLDAYTMWGALATVASHPPAPEQKECE